MSRRQVSERGGFAIRRRPSGAGRELGPARLRVFVAYKRIAFDASPDFHLKTWSGTPDAPDAEA